MPARLTIRLNEMARIMSFAHVSEEFTREMEGAVVCRNRNYRVQPLINAAYISI